MMLLTIFFVSCQSAERGTLCKAVRDYTPEVTEACTFSPKHNTCYCSEFDFDSWKIKGEIRREPLDHCEGYFGFNMKENTKEIRPKMEALKRLKEDSCRKVKE